eukprot:SAG11_NODE_15628_length_571_cov_1.199153_1_plen_49_part_01
MLRSPANAIVKRRTPCPTSVQLELSQVDAVALPELTGTQKRDGRELLCY